MSVGGTSVKTLFLLVVLIVGGAWGWASATTPVPTDLGGGYGNTTVTIPGGFWLASFGAFFVAIFLAVNPRRAALLGVVYAVLQGYCLGAISAAFDAQTDGIVAAAILSTVAVFIVALFLYVTRIVKPTQKLAFAVIVGLGGLSLLYLFVWVLSIFDWGFLYSDEFRTVGIIVTVIAVVLAALSLTLDFGFIEACVDGNAPKFMEWYAGVRAHGDADLAVHLVAATPRAAGAQPLDQHGAAHHHAEISSLMAKLERWMPGIRVVRGYRREWLRPDLIAGSVLAAILVPQGMAYAELAGLPAVTGLYTTIACLVGYAVFGPSRVLVLGPDSSISPLIFAAILPLLVGGGRPGDGDRARGDAGAARRADRDRPRARQARASSPTCSRARCRSAT